MLALAPLIVVTVLYVGQAAILAYRQDWAATVVFVGYAFANVGFLWKLL